MNNNAVVRENRPMSTQASEGRAQEIEHLQGRLNAVASELMPIANPEELLRRLERVARELQDISHELAMVLHVVDIEAGGLEDDLVAIEERLASGWVPPAQDVDALIAELQRDLP